MKNRQSGIFVTPGDKLGVIEEFLPGLGTYVDDGNIYSSTIGHLLIDLFKKKISDNPSTSITPIPKVGDIVVGQVVNIQDKNIVIKISQINTESRSVLTGIMHVSDVSTSYVKTMFNAFKVGDFVRAKVISSTNKEFHLSTKGSNLGVIQAFCSNCGHLLVFQKHRLRCLNCKKIERRKIVLGYEKGLD
ncbi:MAG: exosome complex RNA-binding protein Csl4 [Candidatus Bathyarchaeota archaeon]|nr:MAG: exosome complex RNA-binding protein Csl4 [Candidatus Bathyarchaeota archaeon]